MVPIFKRLEEQPFSFWL